MFLVKENRSITKCLADNNMIKAHTLVEIERICQSNKAITTQIDLPMIRKEIKGLRKQRADQGLHLEDLPKIKAQIEKHKKDIAAKLVEMNEVEDRIAGARNDMSKEI
jgi:predicted  nucleic acid-binding Zn-ribbon protein